MSGLLGLAGAHRTGKTSLAAEFAKKKRLLCLKTSASEIFRDLGLDPAVHYPFAKRLDIQEEILERFEMAYFAATSQGIGIADRTPLDLLAYTLAEAVQDAVSEKEQARFESYTRNCFQALNRHFFASPWTS